MHTDTPPIVVNAVPVCLEGILKESELPVAKRTFTEEKCRWPPPRPHGFHEVSASTSTTSFTMFKTFPISIKAIDEDTA